MQVDVKTIINIKKVAIWFFIITGLFHIGSNVLIANSLYLKQSQIISKTMDIPFIITGLIYGLTSIRLTLTTPDKQHKFLDIFLLSIIILILAGLIIINLALPNL